MEDISLLIMSGNNSTQREKEKKKYHKQFHL